MLFDPSNESNVLFAGSGDRHAQAAHARVQRVRRAEAQRGQRVLQAPLRPHRRARLLRRPRPRGKYNININ